MKLAIMQPYFLPYLGYFQAIAAVDKYILYDNLTYILGGWINRNRIRFPSATPNYISVPILDKSSYSLISDIKIDNSKQWKENMLKSIILAYKKSPFFEETLPLVEDLFKGEHAFISAFNCETITKITRYLDIKTEITSDNSPYFEMEKGLDIIGNNGDYSAFPYLNDLKPEKKVSRAIEMCKREKAETFINAIGGVELYDKDLFAHYGISIYFIKMNDIKYYQRAKDGSFEPNLSIIDVLMNNGKEGTKELLKEYTLI